MSGHENGLWVTSRNAPLAYLSLQSPASFHQTLPQAFLFGNAGISMNRA
jgi:hypothetical protein